MIESLNEEMEIKLSSLSVLLQLVPVASCTRSSQTEKRSDSGMCVLWGPLTECDWQNGCCMWIMRAAVDISDMGE